MLPLLHYCITLYIATDAARSVYYCTTVYIVNREHINQQVSASQLNTIQGAAQKIFCANAVFFSKTAINIFHSYNEKH